MTHAVYLAHLAGSEPTYRSAFFISPATVSSLNILLGEVDKAMLREELRTTLNSIHVFTDDTNKTGEDRHMVRIYASSEKKQKSITYALANILVDSSSGKDQAATDHHILKVVYGDSVTDIIGDNASHSLVLKRDMLWSLASSSMAKLYLLDVVHTFLTSPYAIE